MNNEFETVDILAQVIQRQAEELELEHENNYLKALNWVKVNDQIDALSQKLKETEEKLRLVTLPQNLRDRQNWAKWQTRALAVEGELKQASNELKQASKDLKFWKSCADSSNHLKQELEKENKRLTERCRLLGEELRPYRQARLRAATARIQMESAGQARK